MPKLRVLIMDADASVRARVRALIAPEPDMEVVGEAAGIAEMLARIGQANPDILLTNISVGGGNYLRLLHDIKTNRPSMRILAATMSDGMAYFLEVPPAGALTSLLKSGSPSGFFEALRHTPDIRDARATGAPAAALLSDYAEKARTRISGNRGIHLTRRQEQILRLLAEGLSNQEIAQRLSLKASTVRTHRATLMVKLGMPGRADLIRYAVNRGFIPLAPANLGTV
jgi:DNA-binding NarL/FixJ family response regulator